MKQIQVKVAEKHGNKTYSWKKKQPLYLDICGDLRSVKIAWRNPTMHIVREYNVNEANAVLSAVSNFMIKLAEANFRETGKPVASRIALPA